MQIPFNKPYLTGNELKYISLVLNNGDLSSNGVFSEKCRAWLEAYANTEKALLTHSCTAALEMAAILLNIKPGDEIIMPSYTFVSTSNAFVLRGGVPIFVDIREDTLNINEALIEKAITEKTKAIVVMHYGGVACEMDTIMVIAKKYQLYVIEDAAHALGATYKNKPLGSIGHLGAFSFHVTKNVIAGEGGALLINDPQFIERAEIIREKGTNRIKYFRGEVDKYRWIDIGSSFLSSELISAFLYAQLEEVDFITQSRLKVWKYYDQQFAILSEEGLCKRPDIPKNCFHNGHVYRLLLNSMKSRDNLIAFLKEKDICASFHYFPLHASPAGKVFGKKSGELKVTEQVADTIVRLPVWVGLKRKELSRVSCCILSYFKQRPQR